MNLARASARIFLTGFNVTFLAFLALLVIYVGLDPAEHKFRLYEAPIPLLMGACAVVSVLFYLAERQWPIRRLGSWGRFAVPGIFVASIAAQILVAYALRSSGYTWDSDLILQQAMHYATTGETEPSFAPYLANNPNNIGLLAGLGAGFRLLHHFGFQDFLTAAIALNILTMSAAQVLTYLTVKLLYGRRVAMFSLVFAFVFISLSMYVHIPYTDTLAVVFPVLLCYLALRWARATGLYARMVLSLLIGAAGMAGYLIKPTVAIALVAIVLAGVSGLALHHRRLGQLGRRWWLGTGGGLLAALLVATLAYGAYQKVTDRLHIVPFPMAKSGENAKPPIYFYAMGLRTIYDNTVVYGGYSEEDSEEVAQRLTGADKQAYSYQLARERLAAYGPLGYSSFLWHKANWVMSDATFYAYGEGSNEKVVFRNHDPVSQWVRSFMYIDGRWYVLFGNILQMFWLALLILIAAQLMVLVVRPADRWRAEEALPRLMIAGIILFLLLFEARSRYLFLYVPVFIVAAMSALQWFGQPPTASLAKGREIRR